MINLKTPIPVRFKNHKGEIVDDEIRAFFNKETWLAPYARNETLPAAVLTKHSWIHLSDIVEFKGTA